MSGDRRVALVTGGGKGIGRGISERFARDGYAVAIGQRSEADARRAASELATGYGDDRTIGIGADLSTADGCASLVTQTLDRFGAIDVLVNNAAVTGPAAVGGFLDLEDVRLDAIVDTNLKAPYRCSRLVAREWVRRGRTGTIVFISSVAASAAQYRTAAYSASKAAIESLTRALAVELAEHGIRVVGVAPGDIEVGRAARAEGHTDPFARRTPLGGAGTPADVAAAVSFLCSAEAGFITGETLVVDGGWLST